MNISSDKYFERMLEILTKKQMLLSDMLVLTESQTPAIKSESLDALQQIIEEKQLKIDAIDKLDEEFGVYLERLKSSTKVKSLEELDTSAFPMAKRLKEITGETLALIGRISEIEKFNSSKSKELLDQLGGEIKKINQGKKVNTAYNPVSPRTPSYFVDKKK